MKKRIFRLFYKFGFVHQETIEPIFNSYKDSVSSNKKEIAILKEKITNQTTELARLNKSIEDSISTDKIIISLKKELKETKEFLSVFKKRCKKYEEEEFKLKPDVKKLSLWSASVKELYGNKCDICSSPNSLTAHHLYSKTKHPTLMYMVDNGVCLCEDCHILFHKEYPDVQEITHKSYSTFREKHRI